LDLLFLNHLIFFISRKVYGRCHIRVVNYHGTPSTYQQQFEKQVRFLKRYYDDVKESELLAFLNKGEWNKDKPGIIFSFDDGLRNNYEVALPVLEKYGFTGWFCIPTGFVLCPEDQQVAFARANNISPSHNGQLPIIIGQEQLKKVADNHEVLCHTYHHHRMNNNDPEEVMQQEIIDAKTGLEKLTGKLINGFCWVGGETGTYTKRAYEYIQRNGYQYAFMTNNSPVKPRTNSFWIQRTNIESRMPLYLVRFYISGLYDLFYIFKRKKVFNSLKY